MGKLLSVRFLRWYVLPKPGFWEKKKKCYISALLKLHRSFQRFRVIRNVRYNQITSWPESLPLHCLVFSLTSVPGWAGTWGNLDYFPLSVVTVTWECFVTFQCLIAPASWHVFCHEKCHGGGGLSLPYLLAH